MKNLRILARPLRYSGFVRTFRIAAGTVLVVCGFAAGLILTGRMRSASEAVAVPHARDIARGLLEAVGGDRLYVADLDAIEALADERESLWRRIGAAGFLDEDEKREAVGYGRRAVAREAP